MVYCFGTRSAFVSSPGQGHNAVFLGKTFDLHNASPHPGVEIGACICLGKPDKMQGARVCVCVCGWGGGGEGICGGLESHHSNTKHLMTGPKENREFCFPETSTRAKQN